MLPINSVATIWWDKDKGSILRKAREEKKISTQAISDELKTKGLKYTRQGLSLIENGSYDSVSLVLIIEICNILELEPSSLIPMLFVSPVKSKDFAIKH
jgi:transcriptional regulator with XRE-family HTH domain